MEIGDDTTIVGPLPLNLRVGNRCVVVTESVMRPGAYGHNAEAGPGSIAIGSNAKAGNTVSPYEILENLLNQLLSAESENLSLKAEISTLKEEVRKSEPEKGVVSKLFSRISSFCGNVNSVSELVGKIHNVLESLGLL